MKNVPVNNWNKMITTLMSMLRLASFSIDLELSQQVFEKPWLNL